MKKYSMKERVKSPEVQDVLNNLHAAIAGIGQLKGKRQARELMVELERVMVYLQYGGCSADAFELYEDGLGDHLDTYTIADAFRVMLNLQYDVEMTPENDFEERLPKALR